MKYAIVLSCLLFFGCVTNEQMEYVYQKTESNREGLEIIHKALQDHITVDHQSDAEIPPLPAEPKKPDPKEGIFYKALRWVFSMGGNVHPVLGAAGQIGLLALPFIFGRKEEDEDGS